MTVRWMVMALLATALAGCTDGGSTPANVDGDVDGDPAGTGAVGSGNYSTGIVARDPFTEVIEGSITPLDVYQSFPRYAGLSCCTMQSNEVEGLFVPEEWAHVRLTLEWENTPDNRANLGLAPCFPFHCSSAPRASSMPAPGDQSVSVDIVTGGCVECNTWDARVDIQDGVIATEIPYTLTIDIAPVANALGLADPYEITIPDDAAIAARIHAPAVGAGDVRMIIYGDDDYPLETIKVSGADGDWVPLGLQPGTYVVYATQWNNALVQLQTNVGGEHDARRLTENFAVQTIATVPNLLPASGTYRYEIQPGDLGPFPWFLWGDGPNAQLGEGESRFVAELRSESGVLAYGENGNFGTGGGTQICLNCYGFGVWEPEHFIDLDRIYELTWSVQDAPGEVIVFTTHYER